MNELNITCIKIEKSFNDFNNIPVIELLRTPVRFIFGGAQTTLGLGTGIISKIAEIESQAITRGQEIKSTSAKWKNLSSYGFDHAKHGVLTCGRSSF